MKFTSCVAYLSTNGTHTRSFGENFDRLIDKASEREEICRLSHVPQFARPRPPASGSVKQTWKEKKREKWPTSGWFECLWRRLVQLLPFVEAD